MRAPSLPLLAALLVPGCSGGGEGAASPPPLAPGVLIVIDTLRADHLGCYGYGLDTSPHIDAFAEGATLFEANSTQCNATFPAITSILTGLYPRTHRNYLAVPLEGLVVPPREHGSLAERLEARGYHTLAVVSHPLWTGSDLDAAIHAGWDAFSTIPTSLEGQARYDHDHAGYTNERAFALLDRYDEERDGPLFLWVHYFDPHAAYRPPAEYAERFRAAHLEAAAGAGAKELEYAAKRALYDGEIAYCDSELARLFDRLRERGLFDRALVALVADHGENLAEHHPGTPLLGFNHGRLYEGVARVPLILKLPGQRAGQRVRAITQSIDLLPTVLEVLGLPGDPPVEGRSSAKRRSTGRKAARAPGPAQASSSTARAPSARGLAVWRESVAT